MLTRTKPEDRKDKAVGTYLRPELNHGVGRVQTRPPTGHATLGPMARHFAGAKCVSNVAIHPRRTHTHTLQPALPPTIITGPGT